MRTDLNLLRRTGTVLAALALSLSLAACSTTERKPIAATFVANGVGFSPEVTTVDKENTVIMRVGNGTDAQHGFTIEGYGIRRTVDPNQTVQVRFRAFRAGTFRIFCQLHPTHQTATLRVQ
ncbi:MAG: cupredoxin domain-containing protein [Actinomycetota bacterium]|nr:cupredoxin domain-containing protein [Actinomycetota bacterium]